VMIDHLCGGNPARLRRLAVNFSRPVFPGDTITTTVRREGDLARVACFSYETHNSTGVAVLRDGIAEVDGRETGSGKGVE
jgi:acyl dehydratase